jgi:hypothetical protein
VLNKVPSEQPSNWELAILHGLQSKSLYQGTTDPAVIAERRRANRVARKQRRVNRKRSSR